MFDFQNTISIADLINIGLLLTAIAGIFLTYIKIREGYKTQRATFYKDIYTSLYSDPDIRKAFYLIEYDKFVYDENFHGSEIERLIDRLLTFADLVCSLYTKKAITDYEINYFKYEFARVYRNKNIQNYLSFLSEWYGQQKIGTEPFPRYIAYCKEHFSPLNN